VSQAQLKRRFVARASLHFDKRFSFTFFRLVDMSLRSRFRLASLRAALPVACLAAVSSVFLTGCREERPLRFEPNLVHAMKYQIREEIPMEQASEDAFWITTQMFGTPESPKLPEVVTEEEDFASIVSLENLHRASGPAGAEGRGLYQKHCASCHGVTGDGRGVTAAILNPYPRDYRKGVFKFKSTERGAKPTRNDLAELIRDGIPGSAMVKIPELTEQDVEALVDYVIYLSWRGELERALIDDAIFELDLAGGDRIINPADQASLDEERQELFVESWEIAEDYTLDIGDSWLEADERIVEVPDPPEDMVVSNSYEHFVELNQSDQAAELAQSIERGRELFVGKIASCSKCHGERGLGDGQTTDYDDWTKDWTVGAGIKPENREALVPMLARGALTPLNANPRNFSLGAFHGGDSAKDLYLRITQGIEGSPMPAATFVEGKFEQRDVWHLINYIRSLQTPPEEIEQGTVPEGDVEKEPAGTA